MEKNVTAGRGRNERAVRFFKRSALNPPLSSSLPSCCTPLGGRNPSNGERGGVGGRERKERWGEKMSRRYWDQKETMPDTSSNPSPSATRQHFEKYKCSWRGAGGGSSDTSGRECIHRVSFIWCPADEHSGMGPFEWKKEKKVRFLNRPSGERSGLDG